uniref:BUB1 N-terminal domain-containing protein n=1 Tax=Ditylenchus dipsaci TaxID=166011 RepID=A0A915E0D2_9BILA
MIMNKTEERNYNILMNVDTVESQNYGRLRLIEDPTRGGRRGDTLNEVSSHTNKFTAEDAEERFRLALESANQVQTADPLAEMWDYVVWFEEHFPGGKQRLFYPMLYKVRGLDAFAMEKFTIFRSAPHFCVLSRYKNDERMLKLWLKLAESFPVN